MCATNRPGHSCVCTSAALGGKIVEPKTDIPGQGWYAVIDDTEGNQLGLYENLPSDS